MARVSLLPLLPLLLAGLAPSIGAATPQAYFLLTYDMLAAPSWPADYRHSSRTGTVHHRLFITSPTHFSAELVDKVHTDIPGAKVLAYFDSVSVPLKLGCSTGSPMGNNPIQRRLPDDPQGYYEQLRAGWNASWLLRELKPDGAAPTPLCIFPGLAGYVLQKDSAEFIAKFHHDVTKSRGFDGLYVDMLTDDYWVAPTPPWNNVNLTTPFDCDGDGKPNTVKDVSVAAPPLRLLPKPHSSCLHRSRRSGRAGGRTSSSCCGMSLARTAC